jgi:Ca-activated chloride channel family protein
MTWFNTYQFEDAWVLWFLLIIPVLLFLYFWKGKLLTTSFAINLGIYNNFLQNSSARAVKPLQFIIRTISLAILIIALARPQISKNSPTYKEQYKEGIDIVIALDASGSMLSQDFTPDRFEASKEVAQEFAASRPNDKIGLVIFEGEAYTQCPLTSDNKIVKELIGEAKRGVVMEGTAIGMGLATSVNRLRDSEAKSKVIILLTDGVNTHGKIHPLAAAEMAKEFGIRVYTIGVGTNGQAKTPVAINPVNGKYIYDYVDVEIDEETLMQISKDTGGKYFRATDNQKLKEIYQEIDLLEKAKYKSVEYEVDLPEKSMPLILLALILIGIEIILSTIYKSLS